MSSREESRPKRKRGRVIVAIAVALVLMGVGAWFGANPAPDPPIPGGIVAYRSVDRAGRWHTECGCGHLGYLIPRDDLILWYVTGHDALQPMAEITAREGSRLTFLRCDQLEEPESDSDAVRGTIDVRPGWWRIVDKEYDASYKLKQTWLEPEIRARVEAYDYEAWLAEAEQADGD